MGMILFDALRIYDRGSAQTDHGPRSPTTGRSEGKRPSMNANTRAPPRSIHKQLHKAFKIKLPQHPTSLMVNHPRDQSKANRK